ncbi:hypothetical protein [Arthrobacter sp. 92]|uniref:hypothetical protein n=1 Tax=Arthrobacter sp. 92 TaxID=3418175 RepID=UPI003D086B43
MRRSSPAEDVQLLRWLSDRPIDDDTPAGAVLRAAEQWQSSRGTPFVVAGAQSANAIGLINLKFIDDKVAISRTAFSRPRAARAPRREPFSSLSLGAP